MTSAVDTGPGPIEHWWRELGTAALLGTGRRAVPPLPALPGLPESPGSGDPGTGEERGAREHGLLDAAALAAALTGGGRRLAPVVTGDPAPAETSPTAPPRAAQLLRLLLFQPPAGVDERGLLAHWLGCAARSGRLVPAPLLPTVLAAAGRDRAIRSDVAATAGERGRWLAGLNPTWRWLLRQPGDDADRAGASAGAGARGTDGRATAPTPGAWARLGADERLRVLARVRRSDPAAGRALVTSSWATDGARDRQAQLEALRTGLGPEDEALLETALDDRAGGVRETAADLLDGLAGSARAARMASRLRRVVGRTGLLGRQLAIALPGDPEPAEHASWFRDGLGRPVPRPVPGTGLPPGAKRSTRGWWLEQLCAAAPLAVWSEVSRADPAVTLHRIAGADPDVVPDVVRGLVRAAWLQRDTGWAAALLTVVWEPALLGVLPGPERERLVLDRFDAVRATRPVLEASLAALGPVWSPAFSLAVLDRLRAAWSRAETRPAPWAALALRPYLAAGLAPESLPAVESWLAEVGGTTATERHLSDLLRAVVQVHSLRRSISEAFP